MAYKEEDIMEKLKRTNPKAYHIMKVCDECLAKFGDGKGVVVTITEDMTEEEQEMALFEGCLKEGHPVDVAERKAREWLAMTKEFPIRRRRRGKGDF